VLPTVLRLVVSRGFASKTLIAYEPLGPRPDLGRLETPDQELHFRKIIYYAQRKTSLKFLGN